MSFDATLYSARPLSMLPCLGCGCHPMEFPLGRQQAGSSRAPSASLGHSCALLHTDSRRGMGRLADDERMKRCGLRARQSELPAPTLRPLGEAATQGLNNLPVARRRHRHLHRNRPGYLESSSSRSGWIWREQRRESWGVDETRSRARLAHPCLIERRRSCAAAR